MKFPYLYKKFCAIGETEEVEIYVYRAMTKIFQNHVFKVEEKPSKLSAQSEITTAILRVLKYLLVIYVRSISSVMA